MKILIFAGTSEGRRLIEALLQEEAGEANGESSISICACVATEYGKNIFEQFSHKRLDIRQGRMSTEEMGSLMNSEAFDFVVDSTHPYATEVTKNIKEACQQTGKKYLRLLRDKTDFGKECIFVENTAEAVNYLNTTDGNVLLTTGSKELLKYTEVSGFRERLYARVLPMEGVVNSCNGMGFSGKHLICMQGPFSKGLNLAMLRQLDCRYMVTKDTGKAGGAYEKYEAAKEAGATLIVVGRAEQEEGLDLQGVLCEMGIITYCDINTKEMPAASIHNNKNETAKTETVKVDVGGVETEELASWFPIFVNLNNRNIAVVGAGAIGARRIKTLMGFSCNIRIIAKEVSKELKELADSCSQSDRRAGLSRSVEIFEKEFEIEDIHGADMVLAVTDSGELNQSIASICREMGILVNVASNMNLCDFYFPGVVKQGDLIVGITAQGKNHTLAKKGSAIIREAVKNIYMSGEEHE